MPPLDFLLADQLEPPKRIARHLGVSLRTLYRWKARSNAPRAAYLALWFESRRGASELHTQAFNEVRNAQARIASLEREGERLRRVIRVLEDAKRYPAANVGFFDYSSLGRARRQSRQVSAAANF
ncbi:helix-turn-helix domain-containing protein [Variovorax humicola]|uniref:Helix-turn-helix domain-containing protein n=1 Tax=Variovorax humicola TaxID=1769758 RepID=A0ABU8WBN9_9BURK